MKKSVKIALIVTCSVAAAGVLLYFVGGGLYYRRRAEKEFRRLNEDAPLYPYADRAVPGEYVPVTYGEWTVSSPVTLNCLAQSEEDSAVRHRIFTGDFGGGQVLVMFLERNDFGTLDLMNADLETTVGKRRAKRILIDYCERLGRPVTDWYTLYDFMYHLDSSDCGIASGVRSGMAFYTFAYMKENMLSDYDAWEYHTDSADGFVMRVNPENEEDAKNKCGAFVELYPKDERNTVYTLLIKAPDEDTLYAMVNSAELDPSKAETGDTQ